MIKIKGKSLIGHKSEKEEMTANTNNERKQQEEDLSREKPRSYHFLMDLSTS